MIARRMIARLGIVGAGRMGAGIAHCAAAAGVAVTLVDRDPPLATIAGVRAALDADAARGRLDPARLAGLRLVAGGIADLADADLVIEAAVEDAGVKAAIFRAVSAAAPRALLVTNTSSLSIRALGAASGRPDLAGLHFFNPVPRMRLVEAICADDQWPTLAGFAQALGKTAIRAADSPGFIVNRCARPYYLEASRMLDAGLADAATLDACVASALGAPLGPFALIDLIGLDVNHAASTQMWDALGRPERLRPSPRVAALIAAGRLGRGRGGGFFDATPPPREAPFADHAALLAALRRLAPVAVTDGRPAAGRGPLALIDVAPAPWRRPPTLAMAVAGVDPAPLVAAAADLGVTLVPVSDSAGLIGLRMAAQLIDEARRAVEEAVAEAPDIDSAMALGLNWPVGPFALAATLGPAADAALSALAAAHRGGAYRDPGERPCA